VGAGSRWLVAMAAALACFGGCWAGLAGAQVLDTGSQVGVASVPLVVALAVLGAWAERARETKQEAGEPEDRTDVVAESSPQAQVTGQVSGGLVFGPGASLENSVFNLGERQDRGEEPLSGGNTSQAIRDGSRTSLGSEEGELPVAVPLGRLPAKIRGRDALLAELRRPLTRRTAFSAGTWVLTGMGGVGKSTLALAVAESAQSRGWRVWWVTATNSASLAGGMLEVLRQLSAPESVTRSVREGSPTAVDRAWTYLNGPHPAGHRWLLVFDNADSPSALGGPASTRPGDYIGWLRQNPAGMVIVTTRVKDRNTWGAGVRLRELPLLDEASAAQALTDLAPGIDDPDSLEARELGRRLGGLPLALHLAGSCLASPFARWHSFAAYRQALDGVDLPAALADLDDHAVSVRTTIQQTWDVSLDALEADGYPQARPLLLLLSCYAPATPIPVGLLRAEPLTYLLAYPEPGVHGPEKERQLRNGLRGLVSFGLIDSIVSGSRNQTRAIHVHPVVADANRVRLLKTMQDYMPTVGRAAVELLRSAAVDLDYRRPADWSLWRRITAHIRAVLDWLSPHLDPETLIVLLSVSTSAADALWRSGNHAAAERLARKSMNAAAALGEEHPASLAARQAFAAKIVGRGRYGEAEQLYRQVLDSQRRILGDDHPDTLKTWHRLVRVITERGRYSEAEQLCRKVLRERRRVLGDDHPDTLTARGTLAKLTGMQGRWDEDEQLCRELLSDRLRILGEGHPDSLGTMHGLAWTIVHQGRNSEAERLFRTVLRERERALGEEHPDSLATRHGLYWTIARQGRLAEAELLYRDLLADRYSVMGDEHPATQATRHRLAQVVFDQGRHSEAEKMCQEVLSACEQILEHDNPDMLASRRLLARTIAAQGRPEAYELLSRLLTDHERVLGHNHPDTALTRAELEKIIPSKGRTHN
jgi:tetratricopeptide (TPR) repeat protein